MQKLGPLVVALASVWTLACDPTVELPDGGLNLSLDRGVDPPAAPQVTPPPNTDLRTALQGQRRRAAG
ncbi:MAG: hypothetical protein H6730_04910 [Deltaproteobacteria bacterium]|nr:hypothetical protein [Deltaproteobacteria bacterium]